MTPRGCGVIPAAVVAPPPLPLPPMAAWLAAVAVVAPTQDMERPATCVVSLAVLTTTTTATTTTTTTITTSARVYPLFVG